MNMIEATDAQVAAWADANGGIVPIRRTIGGPAEGPDVIPCPALVTVDIAAGVPIFHVGYQLDENELATLNAGGTLWMTTWGGLPIHRLDAVVSAEPEPCTDLEHLALTAGAGATCPRCGLAWTASAAIDAAMRSGYRVVHAFEEGDDSPPAPSQDTPGIGGVPLP